MTYGGRVFIGGISSNVSKDDIGNEFSKFGKLRTVWVASKPPGFAFVEYDDGRDAEEAVKSLNGVSLFNENKIRVEISKKRPGQRSMPPNRRSYDDGPNRSNPNFRTGNSTSFKPKPRFLNSTSRTGTGPPRLSQGQRFPPRGRISGGPPRFDDEGSQTSRSFSSQNSRFPNSRGTPRFGQQSQTGSGGYKSGNFRNSRPMD